MADTFTTELGLTKPEVNGSEDTWGDKLNENADELEKLHVGVHSINSTGGSVTLTESQSRNRYIDVTGTLVSNLTINVPDKKREWIVYNGTTGSFTVTIKPSSTGYEVTQGKRELVRCTGTTALKGIDAATSSGGGTSLGSIWLNT